MARIVVVVERNGIDVDPNPPYPAGRPGGTLLAGPAWAAPRALTIASLFGEDKPETRIWRFFAERVEQALPGRFRFNLALNAALGGEKEVAEGTRLGSVQGGLCTVSALSAWVAEGQMLDLPFLFRDRAHISRALAGPPAKRWHSVTLPRAFNLLGLLLMAPGICWRAGR